MILGRFYFQKDGKTDLSIIELQMPHFEVYEGGNIEFLLFSFAVFDPIRKEAINSTFSSSKK